MASVDEETRKKFFFTLTTLMCRFLTFPIPTVAAINGKIFLCSAY
jgi:enoyl-CoA hydratase/carnithine racemase